MTFRNIIIILILTFFSCKTAKVETKIEQPKTEINASEFPQQIGFINDFEKIFTEDGVAGAVFSLTGIRHGAFGISVNARHPKGYSHTLISVLKDNSIPALWLVRKTFLESPTYAEATRRLR